MRRTITLCLFAICVSAMAQNNTIEVNTKKIGAPIQSTMYGIFFEDINYAADGGLYGELVKNRSFEFPQHLMGWQAFGCVDVEDDNAPFERCPHYVILSDPGHKDRRSGLVNEGYFGIGIEKGEAYRFSVWAKAPKGTAAIRVQLIKENSMDEKQEFVEEEINITSSQWKKYTVTRRGGNQYHLLAMEEIYCHAGRSPNRETGKAAHLPQRHQQCRLGAHLSLPC